VTDRTDVTGQRDDWLWVFVKCLPAPQALLRALEARVEEAAVPAGSALTIGRDALSGEHYDPATAVVDDDPWRLPFPSARFRTVVCHRVLAGAPDVEAALAELARVLRRPDPVGDMPGGRLILTLPSEEQGQDLLLSAWLRRAGLTRAADGYRAWYRHSLGYRHCDPVDVWHARLASVGLRTVSWHYLVSPPAERRLEVARWLAWPSAICKAIFDRSIVAPWRSSLQWTERWLRPAFQEPAPAKGAYLVLVAERAGEGEAVGPLAAPDIGNLPSHLPLTPLAEAPETDSSSDQGIEREAGTAASVQPGWREPVSEEVTRIRAIVWLGAALLLALIGQVSWNWQSRPSKPGSGFFWYLLALIAFGLFVWQSAPRSRPLLDIPGRRLALARHWVRLRQGRVLLFVSALAFSWISWLRVRDAVRPTAGPAGVLLLWGLGILLATLALWPGGPRHAWKSLRARIGKWARRAANGAEPRDEFARRGWPAWEVAFLGVISLVAFLLRYVNLAEIPYLLAGDEANMGHEAVRILNGELTNPFITGWFSHPTLFYFILALPIRVFGQGVYGVRFLSPIIGTLTVPVTYFFARRAWGRSVAMAAAILLAGYHFHIHYSRLGLNNIWDPLFALVVMGLLWRGWTGRDRRLAVLGGLVLGISQYFYMGSRMLVIMVLAMVVYVLIVDRRRALSHEGAAFLGTVVAVALVVALPITLFSVRHPDDFMARMNQLGIFQSGWLDREVEITGRSAGSLLWDQVWKSALAFNYTVDPTFWYRPGIPLLRLVPSIFFVFGLALSLARIRRMDHFLLLLWIGATVIFAGVLLENPPSSQRFVIAAPAVCMAVALALVWVGERLRTLLGGRQQIWAGGLLVVALWIAQGDARFYLVDYTSNADFGGLNTEVANRVADYLNDLGSDWEAFFFGPPRMGISKQGGFPSTPFLAPDVQTLDVWDPLQAISGLPPVRMPAVFIFLPERAGEIGAVKEAYPAGIEKHFPGRYGRILFLAYEVRAG
jgi:4-amino-4-deoxy-L-arabinose transferase-like glycosyltransferase/SAM-dependent methyltransferase